MSAKLSGTARSRRQELRAKRRAGHRVRLPVSNATSRCSCGRVFYATTSRVAIDARNDHERKHR